MMLSMIITPHLNPQSFSSLPFTPNSNPNDISKQHTFTLSNSTNPPSPPTPNNPNIEIRVCTNRTCRKQGSFQIRDTLLGISPPHVSVNSCGCLGRCGSGPNLLVLPPAAFVSHCGTAARAADLMVDVCGGGGGDDFDLAKRTLDSLAFRKRAEKEFQTQNFAEAETLFSQAIDAKPIGGIHIAYKGRSAVRLALGNFSGALDDVNEALVYSPRYAEAYICQGDILLAMDQLEDAQESYVMALESDPSLHRSKAFKARIQMLQDKMTSAAIP